MSEVTTAAFAPPAVAGVAANHRYQWGTDHRLGPGGPNGDAVAASSRIPKARRPASGEASAAGLSSACHAGAHDGCPDRLGASAGRARCGCGCHRRAERLAVMFYLLAASAAVIGQVWVAVEHIAWPAGWPLLVQVAAVGPFAACLELLGMATAALADQRMRLGERALGLRVFSAAVAMVAVSVIVVGHWPDLYLVVGFGAFSAAAYLLWMLHAGARRRDALRVAGLLGRVTPAYGFSRWCPWLGRPGWRITVRARELAREHGLDLHESLAAAQREAVDRERRPAIAAAVEAVVRANHPDPLMAEIAVKTLDHDRIAEALERQADYAGWAMRLAAAVSASPTESGKEPHSGAEPPVAQVTSAPDTSAESKQAGSAKPARARAARMSISGERARARRDEEDTAVRVVEAMSRNPQPTKAAVARELGISERTVYRYATEAAASAS